MDLLCLQEVKTFILFYDKYFSLWGDSNVGWLHNEGESGAGFTLTMWHREAFCYDSHMVGKGYISIFGEHIKSKSKCVVINVYATCNLNEKVVLWENLLSVKNAHLNLAWCSMKSEMKMKGKVLGVAKRRKLVVLIASLRRTIWYSYQQSVTSSLGTKQMVQ